MLWLQLGVIHGHQLRLKEGEKTASRQLTFGMMLRRKKKIEEVRGGIYRAGLVQNFHSRKSRKRMGKKGTVEELVLSFAGAKKGLSCESLKKESTSDDETPP